MLHVKFNGEKLAVKFGFYHDGKLGIDLWDGEFPYARSTVWVDGLQDGELAVKDYSENVGMLKALIQAGVVEKPHRTIRQGHVSIPVVRLTEKAMSEALEQLELV